MAEYDYDVIIVGAGPAGSTTARYIKPEKNNIKILIIERKKEVGIPVQCGEAISKISVWKTVIPDDYALEELLDIPKNVIAQEIKNTDWITPFQTHCRFDTPGFMLHRNLFDQHLVKLAIRNGAELRLNTSMKGIKDQHIVITSNGNVTGNIIVGADGPRSITAKSSGLKTPNDICPLSSAVFSIVRGDFDDDINRIYFGKRFAGGYAWVFPKGDTANIGMGTEWIHKIPIKMILNNFLKDLGVSSKDILYNGGGLIPMGGPIPKFVSDNVLIVGDAAGMVFPSNGGGIVPAMIAGRECGIAIANYLKNGIPLDYYEQQWKKILSNTFKKSLKEKNRYLWMTKHDLLLEIGFRILRKKIFTAGSYIP